MAKYNIQIQDYKGDIYYPLTNSKNIIYEDNTTLEDQLNLLKNSIATHTHTKKDVGLNNVDNTSDLNKPISSATQAALDKKVDKTSIIENKEGNWEGIPIVRGDGCMEIGKYIDFHKTADGTTDFDARIFCDDNGLNVTTTLIGSTIKGNLVGNSDTTTKLKTARSIGLSGAVTGNANFDGSANITINTTIGNIPTIYSGTDNPANSLGKNGSIYIKR